MRQRGWLLTQSNKSLSNYDCAVPPNCAPQTCWAAPPFSILAEAQIDLQIEGQRLPPAPCLGFSPRGAANVCNIRTPRVLSDFLWIHATQTAHRLNSNPFWGAKKGVNLTKHGSKRDTGKTKRSQARSRATQVRTRQAAWRPNGFCPLPQFFAGLQCHVCFLADPSWKSHLIEGHLPTCRHPLHIPNTQDLLHHLPTKVLPVCDSRSPVESCKFARAGIQSRFKATSLKRAFSRASFCFSSTRPGISQDLSSKPIDPPRKLDSPPMAKIHGSKRARWDSQTWTPKAA